MNEQEMRDEIERLRRELADVTKSRDRLREMICAILPVDPPKILEKDVEEMMAKPSSGIDDIIARLLGDDLILPGRERQIPA